MPFVGREGELAALCDAFDSARRGALVSVVVSGEAGVGKSALVRTFVERIGREVPETWVLAGRCYERRLSGRCC